MKLHLLCIVAIQQAIADSTPTSSLAEDTPCVANVCLQKQAQNVIKSFKAFNKTDELQDPDSGGADDDVDSSDGGEDYQGDGSDGGEDYQGDGSDEGEDDGSGGASNSTDGSDEGEDYQGDGYGGDDYQDDGSGGASNSTDDDYGSGAPASLVVHARSLKEFHNHSRGYDDYTQGEDDSGDDYISLVALNHSRGYDDYTQGEDDSADDYISLVAHAKSLKELHNDSLDYDYPDQSDVYD